MRSSQEQDPDLRGARGGSDPRCNVFSVSNVDELRRETGSSHTCAAPPVTSLTVDNDDLMRERDQVSEVVEVVARVAVHVLARHAHCCSHVHEQRDVIRSRQELLADVIVAET